MADTPVLVTATLVASTVLGLIGQKVARANAREKVEADLLVNEQKRLDMCEEKFREYRENTHQRNNDLMVKHMQELAGQDRSHATELASLRKEMFDAKEKHDGECDKLRDERDKYKGMYMDLHAEVSARKTALIGSIEVTEGKEIK